MKNYGKGAIYYVDADTLLEPEINYFVPVLIIYDYKERVLAVIIKNEDLLDDPKYYISLKSLNKIRPNSKVGLEKIKVLEKKDLKGFAGFISESDIKKIDKSLRLLFGI